MNELSALLRKAPTLKGAYNSARPPSADAPDFQSGRSVSPGRARIEGSDVNRMIERVLWGGWITGSHVFEAVVL